VYFRTFPPLPHPLHPHPPHIDKWQPRVVDPNYFCGNIKNIYVERSLENVVLLSEDHGGEGRVRGDLSWLVDYDTLTEFWAKNRGEKVKLYVLYMHSDAFWSSNFNLDIKIPQILGELH